MDGTYSVVMGDRGRLVVPAELRERWHLDAGTRLVLLETSDGIVLTNRQQLLRLVRAQLAGPSLVEQLVADRRRAALTEDSS